MSDLMTMMPNSSSAQTSPELQEEPENPNLVGTKYIKGSTSYTELLALLEKWYSESKNIRTNFEKQWYTNLAFYLGRQYVQWTTAKAGPISVMYEPPAPPWRVRLIANKIKIIVRRELAKVTQEKPTGFVIPATSEEEDLAAARAGDMIMEYLWRELKMNKTTRTAEFWTLICGTAFIKDGFDPRAVATDGSYGAIVTEALTPWHVFVSDIQEEDIEKQHHVIHAMAKDPQWAKDRFNDAPVPKSNVSGEIVDQKFMSALGINQQNQKNKCYIKECWIKPGMDSRWPNGLVVIWGDGVLLYVQEEWPYLHNEYPFTKLEHIPTGRFYADSVICDLIPLQKEYNRSRSQIVEAKNRMSKPQLVAPKGSIEPKKITSEPGLVIEYTPGFQPPTPLPLQNLPSYVFEHINSLQSDMDDISSQHEVSQGRTPPGVSAATAISFLQEEDDSVLAPTISSLEEGVEKLGKHFLQHVQQHWDANRQINVMGTNGQFESFMFTKSSLKGNTNYVVQAGSATPRSRAAKQAFIMEIGKLGWIPPQHALRFLDMTETGRLYEELQVDVRQAQRENLKLSMQPPEQVAQQRAQPKEPITDLEGNLIPDPATGEPMQPEPDKPWVPVNDFDNDQVHLATHETYAKTQSYEALPPDVRYEHDLHREWHKVQIASKMGIHGLRPFDPQLNSIINGSFMNGLQGQGQGLESEGEQQGQLPA